MYIVQQWLTVLLLVCTLRVLSSPVASSNSKMLSPMGKHPMDMTQKIANLSIGGIPADFKLLLLMGPNRPFHLPNKAYYYSAIEAVEKLALEDWDGVMGNREFESTKYRQLRITTNTRYGSIPRKYVIWGLVLSCGLMDQVTGFGGVFFEVQWQGREVGGLAYTLIQNPLPLHFNSENLSNTTEETEQNRVVSSNHRNATYSTALSDKTTSQTGLTVPSNAVSVKATFERYGGALNEAAVYLTVLMALVHAAGNPEQRRVNRLWRSETDEYHAEIITNQQPPSRSQPPYYTFETLIRSLALYAKYFVAENKLYETTMLTWVGNVVIGVSVLRKIRTGSDQAEVSTA